MKLERELKAIQVTLQLTKHNAYSLWTNSKKVSLKSYISYLHYFSCNERVLYIMKIKSSIKLGSRVSKGLIKLTDVSKYIPYPFDVSNYHIFIYQIFLSSISFYNFNSLSLSLMDASLISHYLTRRLITHNEKERSPLNLRNVASTFWQLRQLSKSLYRWGSHNFDLILHYYIDLNIWNKLYH